MTEQEIEEVEAKAVDSGSHLEPPAFETVLTWIGIAVVLTRGCRKQWWTTNQREGGACCQLPEAYNS